MEGSEDRIRPIVGILTGFACLMQTAYPRCCAAATPLVCAAAERPEIRHGCRCCGGGCNGPRDHGHERPADGSKRCPFCRGQVLPATMRDCDGAPVDEPITLRIATESLKPTLSSFLVTSNQFNAWSPAVIGTPRMQV